MEVIKVLNVEHYDYTPGIILHMKTARSPSLNMWEIIEINNENFIKWILKISSE